MNLSLQLLKNNFIRYYFALYLLVGIIYVFILPPFHSPDEFNHFYRIYHITEGHFWPELSPAKDTLGGRIAQSLLDVSPPFERAVFHKEIKIPEDTILRYLFYPLNKQKTTFAGFVNTARYPPTAYLPQIAVVGVLKIFNTPPIILLYAARIAVLLFWLCSLYVTLRIAPVFKELLAILAVTPTCAAVSSSVSADVVSNAFMFLQIALFLKWKFGGAPVSRPEKWLFAALALVVTLNKLCYFPIVLLLLMVGVEKFDGLSRKYLYVGGLFAACLALIAVWGRLMHYYIYPFGGVARTTYQNMRPGFDVNPDLQIQYILGRPFTFLWRFWLDSLDAYTQGYGYIGTCGWDVGVPSGFAIACVIFLIVFSCAQKVQFTFGERVWLIVLAHSMNMFLLFLMHLNWDAVGDVMINYYHGKYYIPIYPLFFFALAGLVDAAGLKKAFAWALNWRTFFLYAAVVNIEMFILILQRFYF